MSAPAVFAPGRTGSAAIAPAAHITAAAAAAAFTVNIFFFALLLLRLLSISIYPFPPGQGSRPSPADPLYTSNMNDEKLFMHIKFLNRTGIYTTNKRRMQIFVCILHKSFSFQTVSGYFSIQGKITEPFGT